MNRKNLLNSISIGSVCSVKNYKKKMFEVQSFGVDTETPWTPLISRPSPQHLHNTRTPWN